MVRQSKEAGAKVLILGMRLSPNYGQRYTTAFAEVFPKVAQDTGAALVPFMLEGVGGVASMMQADGIHPTASAQSRLLDNVWPTLKPMLWCDPKEVRRSGGQDCLLYTSDAADE